MSLNDQLQAMFAKKKMNSGQPNQSASYNDYDEYDEYDNYDEENEYEDSEYYDENNSEYSDNEYSESEYSDYDDEDSDGPSSSEEESSSSSWGNSSTTKSSNDDDGDGDDDDEKKKEEEERKRKEEEEERKRKEEEERKRKEEEERKRKEEEEENDDDDESTESKSTESKSKEESDKKHHHHHKKHHHKDKDEKHKHRHHDKAKEKSVTIDSPPPPPAPPSVPPPPPPAPPSAPPPPPSAPPPPPDVPPSPPSSSKPKRSQTVTIRAERHQSLVKKKFNDDDDDESSNETQKTDNDTDNEQSTNLTDQDRKEKCALEMIQGKTSKYEQAMRALSKNYLEPISMLLSICCSTRDLLRNDLPKIIKCVDSYIHQHVQNFVMNSLEVIFSHSDKIKNIIESDLMRIRALLGYFKNGSELEIKVQNKKEIGKKKLPDLLYGPHISALNLLRHQLQTLINPENELMSTKMMAKTLEKGDVELIQNFLDDTQFYTQLLQFHDTLNEACDMSSLYFKECFLDIFRQLRQQSKDPTHCMVYFPITTSLPYLLINYALDHPENQNLISSIFFPLSIYDDAASVALKKMKSQTFFNEIETESKLTLTTISSMISDYAFKEVLTFETERYFEQYDSQIFNQYKRFLRVSSESIKTQKRRAFAYRIAVILQQNQLFLLSQKCDVKAAFALQRTLQASSNLLKITVFLVSSFIQDTSMY